MTQLKLDILVISLKNHHGRHREIAERFCSLGWSFEFFNACTPDVMPGHVRRYFYDEDGTPWTGFMLPGEIGCYASHLTIMHEVVSGKLPSPLIVMEDDAEPTPEVKKIFELAYQLMLEDENRYQYINFYTRETRAAIESIKIGMGVKLIRNFIPNYRTHCYMISRSGCENFINFRERRIFPIDEDIILASLESDMKVWETVPTVVGCADEADEHSDVDPQGIRSGRPRPHAIRLKNKLGLARAKYGRLHELRYRLSRKLWKLKNR